MDTLYKMYRLRGEMKTNIVFLPLMKNSMPGNITYRAIRKFHLSSSIGCKDFWFADWTSILWNFDTIIMGETGNTTNVARYIKKKYPNKRVIIWWRNSVERSVKPLKCQNIYEPWSFDRSDCKKYKMKYNPQFYIKSPAYKEMDIEYDAFFVGKDKGRLQEILQLENDLNKYGLVTKFLIVGYNSNPLEYIEILDYIGKSRAIVDLQGEWQNGITLRPLEALFYKKKLITNSKDVLYSDYYTPNNVFCITKDDISTIKEFMRSPLDVIPENIVNNYGLSGWVNRFLNDIHDSVD